MKKIRVYAIHLVLFIITLLTTMMVGAELVSTKMWFAWMYTWPEGISLEDIQLPLSDLVKGIPYSFSFLAFLTFHEFGHYFMAVYHRVKSSLPYYIPIYIPLPILNIGSFGAVIRLKQIPDSTRKYFDIGIAGPLAGFVISILLLVYGFSHLPDINEYVLNIHPEYQEIEPFCGLPTDEQMRTYMEGGEGRQAYYIGNSLLFEFLKQTIPSDPTQVPSHFELMHYPFLFVGYITLFFTALNLLPIGQLDGGHIIYGMFGRKISGYVSRLSVLVLLFIGGTGFANFQEFSESYFSISLYLLFLYYVSKHLLGSSERIQVAALALSIFAVQLLLKWNFPDLVPNLIWLIYAFLVVRVIGLDHPPAMREHKVNQPRQILGWLTILIFILCFTPEPILVIGG